MIFSPRDYQGAIIRQIVGNPRCALWAGMGTGKTAATLTALEELDLIEDVYPALVIAPLRVAASVWPDEVDKWDHLRHLRVSPIVGSAQERIEALRQSAEIYTLNYENLPWLVEHLGEDWRFPTVVADESTKLKGFRLRQGTQRARALGSVAHARVERLIELTGTPAPNGLADLWGQAWFLDAGRRLGRTHSAFTDRWFRLKYDGYGLEPLPHAQGEIQARLADLCLTITAADYFDLPPLIENEVKVDLPEPARRIYRDMEQAMFAQIDGHDVEAFNAAAKTNKCLQLANGAAYVDDLGAWKEVHDAKLIALEDIVEEAAGAPVLVAYQFRSDLARILKKFGKAARHLDRDPQTLRDWNVGKIPLLVAHPASAGHGLNLQDGGHILAYFSSGWNLEEDQQILERIGPTRQAQAGLNREVYVHRIVARDTVDELVALRRQSKADVQQMLLDYMKRAPACSATIC
ncbi:DEAD/DEAH box helicase [Accumulibacter sp.]|uniref:DEAD/DEAH box helicase n=1 Tax=Accumulibacter sp. TaxID=2053492 RepID=UPI0025EE7925|nr:DEAD/DEAH box helicase [Accumulibacter sp.]MCM8595146.1 DEAD/DEAH box helicase [Accumulibacter sp.]MCM8626191.1 DEAD/DEAH box helicase [Accumulibacter sp.]MDS4049292.1 DEAD/DEAH box helicase [Accumulibacter sp.]